MAKSKKTNNNYDSSKIVKLSHFDHIRQRPGMYIGSTDNPDHLFMEVFDNSIDECLAGTAKNIEICLSEGEFSIADDGRGIPCNPRTSIEKDPPVMICTSLFTSGKFKKGTKDSAYSISTGLHGIGLSAVTALSEYIQIDIYKGKTHYIYKFENDIPTRSKERFSGKAPYSTKVTVKPNKKYFDSLEFSLDKIEERSRIVVASYPEVNISIISDNNKIEIKDSEEDLIQNYLSKKVEKWFEIDTKNKKGESCHVKFGWEDKPSPSKIMSSVNLTRTVSGVHINKLLNSFRSEFKFLSKKYNYNFNKDDWQQGFRAYVSLEIINTSFSAQVKSELEKNSDISVMDGLDKSIRYILTKDEEYTKYILESFQLYRQSLRSKRITKKVNSGKRSSTKFTKLRDCSDENGELIICEGDSAAGGLLQSWDPKKHAILPLKGVIMNAANSKTEDLIKNQEINEIITALGCGIESECDVEKLRYDKIIIATDSDPAGAFISSLLMVLFARLTPDVIKEGKLYLSETPLYGTYNKDKFIPLWTKEEVEKERKKKGKILRFKGLGEFVPKELSEFIFNEKTRKLIQVPWPGVAKIRKIFKLFSSSSEKYKLVSGKWKIK